jgi:hypothetical protein
VTFKLTTDDHISQPTKIDPERAIGPGVDVVIDPKIIACAAVKKRSRTRIKGIDRQHHYQMVAFGSKQMVTDIGGWVRNGQGHLYVIGGKGRSHRAQREYQTSVIRFTYFPSDTILSFQLYLLAPEPCIDPDMAKAVPGIHHFIQNILRYFKNSIL